MEYAPKLTYWLETIGPDGNIPDEVDEFPFYSTAGQEDRYRRLAAILEECEAEVERMKWLDPKNRSDQSHGIREELSTLQEAVSDCATRMNLSSAPREQDRILEGGPYSPAAQPSEVRERFRVIRGGKG